MTGTRRQSDKLQAALDSGQLWRAKEILAGRVGGNPYDAATCEQLGQLLLRMGDDLQAGKFLFLSGVRKREYADPIGLYLRRHKRGGWQSLLGTFPAAARHASWAHLPPAVRDELRAAGMPARPDGETIKATERRFRQPLATWRGMLSALGCLVVLILLGLLFAAALVYFIET